MTAMRNYGVVLSCTCLNLLEFVETLILVSFLFSCRPVVSLAYPL
jgi:hypothetical protein